MTIPAFQKTIWDYYHAHPRPMPWRETTDPYHIYVSEVMLQQTQVDRVLSKYTQFVRLFPNWGALADAPLTDVLRVWQGLGYNRRALLLQKSARIISDTYSQKLPNDPQLLEQLPGIGHATARSIVGFAYNKPVVFIETNIRSVFIHFFFSDRSDVDDTELLPLIKKSCHQENVREWYWALMDYGVMLKKSGNPSQKSKQYVRQSTFIGSDRQVRGEILRALTKGKILETELFKMVSVPKERFDSILTRLVKEGLAAKYKEYIKIPV